MNNSCVSAPASQTLCPGTDQGSQEAGSTTKSHALVCLFDALHLFKPVVIQPQVLQVPTVFHLSRPFFQAVEAHVKDNKLPQETEANLPRTRREERPKAEAWGT